MSKLIVHLAAFVSLTAALPLFASDPYKVIRDIPFAQPGGHHLALDLYLPNGAKDPALVVYVHGGAWRAGSKGSMPLTGLLESGFAVASVDYRLSPIARFPAQIHDIKAAIRFLRAKRSEYGYDADRIVIAGSSAGGHLAALVGVTNGHQELEGSVGDHLQQSSDVQAIVSYYGASNFETILSQSTPRGLGVRIPALQLLLGAQPEDKPHVAKLASPVFHVDRTDPPLLLLHGDQDPQMPVNQSIELEGKYTDAGVPVALEFVHSAAHGGKLFYDADRNRVVVEFLEKHLR
jgi:acetyl esterase/lipase